MTAYELAHMLLDNIEQGHIDEDLEVLHDMGAYCREVNHVWLQEGLLHVGSQPPTKSWQKELDHCNKSCCK